MEERKALTNCSTLNIQDESENGNDDKMVIRPCEQQDMEIHSHRFFELTYITGGTAEHNLNGHTSIVSKGDYFIVDYGSFHSYRNCRDFTLINCLFLPELIDETLADCRVFDEMLKICLVRYYKQYYRQATANRVFRDESGKIQQLISDMLQEYRNRDMGFSEILRGKLLEILILTMRKVAEEQITVQNKSSESTVVQEAVQYLRNHYRDRTVITRFCEEYHYSLQYVSRKFRQETGMSAMEYLQKIRIEKCCELLSGTDMQVQEIARLAGYEDVKFFYKIFRRMLHMSPLEYRRVSIV